MGDYPPTKYPPVKGFEIAEAPWAGSVKSAHVSLRHRVAVFRTKPNLRAQNELAGGRGRSETT